MRREHVSLTGKLFDRFLLYTFCMHQRDASSNKRLFLLFVEIRLIVVTYSDE